MRWQSALIAASLTAALLLTGCSSKDTPTPPAPPVEKPPAPPEGAILSPTPAGTVVVEKGTGGNIKLEKDLLFLMDPATGAHERWTLSGPANPDAWMTVALRASDDGRWVIIRTKETGYLADRTSGAVYQWDRNKHELVAAAADRLVFEAAEPIPGAAGERYHPGWGPHGKANLTGQFKVLDGSFRSVSSFAIDGIRDINAPRLSLFSPDGRALALYGNGQLFLVDMASGGSQKLAAISQVWTLKSAGDGKSFTAPKWPVMEAAPTQWDWQGKELAAPQPGLHSPDGKYTALTELLSGVTLSVEIRENATGKPLMRVLGADLCYGQGLHDRWDAGGTSLTMWTKEGLRTLSLNGTLTEPGLLKDGNWHDPVPSPTRSGLFADLVTARDGSGMRLDLVNNSGNKQHTVYIDRGVGIFRGTGDPRWHPSGKLVQLGWYVTGGSGGPCGDYPVQLGPKVQKAPFAAQPSLVVQNTGDCLNLRESPSKTARVLACLKDGSRLTLAGSDGLTWADEAIWMRVSAPDGQVGWVTMEGGYISWAD